MKNIKNWRQFKNELNITNCALWIDPIKKNDTKFVIPDRTELPENSSIFHGIFIPEIPFQFITRFTEENDVIWDCFGGSGTTYKVAKQLNRQCIINDLNPMFNYIEKGDSISYNPGQQVDLIFCHPPYHNIINYSQDENDGSSFKTIKEYVNWFKLIQKNISQYLKEDGFVILVFGNIYFNSEEVELGEICKNIFLFNGFILKSHIIKEYGETKGKSGKDYNLNYVRGLRGNYNQFYGDNIYMLQKKKSKNNLKEIYDLL
jgi:DNA modification methylase